MIQKFKDSSDNVKMTLTIVSIVIALLMFIATTFLDPVRGNVKTVNEKVGNLSDKVDDQGTQIALNEANIEHHKEESRTFKKSIEKTLDTINKTQTTMSEDIKDILKALPRQTDGG